MAAQRQTRSGREMHSARLVVWPKVWMEVPKGHRLGLYRMADLGFKLGNQRNEDLRA